MIALAAWTQLSVNKRDTPFYPKELGVAISWERPLIYCPSTSLLTLVSGAGDSGEFVLHFSSTRCFLICYLIHSLCGG